MKEDKKKVLVKDWLDEIGSATVDGCRNLSAEDMREIYRRFSSVKKKRGVERIPELDHDEVDLFPIPILEEAQAIISSNRDNEYPPWTDQSADVVALMKILYPDLELTDKHFSMIMILYKMTREAHHPKRDNRLDAAGYFGLLDTLYPEG